MYTVIQTERALWTVGKYEAGTWNPVGDFSSMAEAEQFAERKNAPHLSGRVADLEAQVTSLQRQIDRLQELVTRIRNA